MERPLSAELRTLNRELFDYIMIHHPSLIFSPRQKKDYKTRSGIAFLTGNKNTSEYIAIPLMRKGAGRGNSISFVITFNKNGVLENAIEIYYDPNFDEEDKLIHNKIVDELKLSTKNQDYPNSLEHESNKYVNKFLYKNPQKYLNNLEDYIKNKSKIFENVVKSFGEKKIKEYSIDPTKFLNKINNIKAIMEAPNPENINQETIQKVTKTSGEEKKLYLNQILYGPPGTGKTYNTINKALEIVLQGSFKNFKSEYANNRSAYTTRFKELQFDPETGNGRIAFITFHQSMSYEDFIEGIKPKFEDASLGYDIVPGIFKLLSDMANAGDDNFYEKIDALKQLTSEAESKPPLIISNGENEFTVSYREGRTFRIKPKNSKNPDTDYPASIENIRKLYEGGSRKEVYNPTYVNGILKYLFQNGLKPYNKDRNFSKPYVLIIDEINRGNVSQIFGELITLIEKDKRLGMDEALTVTLPYSKTNFGVPPNLYIIGTMNTADRSVEALDTALRRRFNFIQMPPQPELIAQNDALTLELGTIKLHEILSVINERIEILLDKDHLIGHSFFMNLKNLEELKFAFYNNIIPLLQEYFYGDYGKIGLVLGNAFCVLKENVNKVVFPNVKGYETPDYSDKQIFELINFEGRDSNVKFINALKFLLNPGSEVE